VDPFREGKAALAIKKGPDGPPVMLKKSLLTQEELINSRRAD
jgi:hypothetical protein